MARFRTKIAGIILALGMLGGVGGLVTAEPAGATFVGPRITSSPTNSACYHRYWFDQGTWNPSPAVGDQSGSWYWQTGGCTGLFQYKVLCGVYGSPGTYYWHAGQYTSQYIPGPNQFVPSGFPTITFNNNDACPIWGNDIIMNVVILEQTGGANWCWSENNTQWIYNCIGVTPHNYIDGNQSTYWA